MRIETSGYESTYFTDTELGEWGIWRNGIKRHSTYKLPSYHEVGGCKDCEDGMPPGIELLLKIEALKCQQES